MGLQNTRWTATDKQIRDAYKRAALEHHPDKVASAARQRENESNAAAEADGEEVADGEEFNQDAAEAHFKLVQEAYETLSDPARRREFDSTDWFDDTLPQECGEEEGAFYTTFAPAFKRQARWSAAPGGVDAVPDLGDADTPWDKVDKFYDFWFAFKSWREFPHEDEEDVDGAESREEKRCVVFCFFFFSGFSRSTKLEETEIKNSLFLVLVIFLAKTHCLKRTKNPTGG